MKLFHLIVMAWSVLYMYQGLFSQNLYDTPFLRDPPRGTCFCSPGTIWNALHVSLFFFIFFWILMFPILRYCLLKFDLYSPPPLKYVTFPSRRWPLLSHKRPVSPHISANFAQRMLLMICPVTLARFSSHAQVWFSLDQVQLSRLKNPDA